MASQKPNRMKILKKRIKRAEQKAEAYGAAFDEALVAAQRLLQELAARAQPDPLAVKRAHRLIASLAPAAMRPLEITGRNVDLFFLAKKRAIRNNPKRWLKGQLKQLTKELGE